MTKAFLVLLCGLVCLTGEGIARDGTEKRSIHVLVALCDNETQGIVKVNPRIGNGDDLDRNLYWGCAASSKKAPGGS